MTSVYPDERLRGQSPGNYRIRVEGRLGAEWSDRMGGLQISTESEGARSITTLSGWLIDQASLLGVVNILYDLQLTILSVERLDAVTS